MIWGSALVALVLGAAIAFVSVDTDPENMLAASDPVRVRNAEMREAFGADQRIVVGLVEPTGALTPTVLAAADALRQKIERIDGVEGDQVVSFASAANGPIRLGDPADVDRIVAEVEANPVLAGNVLSADGTTVAIFVPLEAKDEANHVSAAIEEEIADDRILSALDSYVAGLPLAEEEFGRQMFIQMGIFAPLAGLLVFALMLFFFRSLILVLAGMAVAMLTVISTMGLLIATGNELHIMSSMIPIFLMPIAILDSVHVFSEFRDRYPALKDRRATLRAVYGELFRPLTFTSLTTAVAFASLAIAPIPPVRVFGAFVAVGVLLAWLLTLVFIPAYVVSMSERRLQRTLGAQSPSGARLSAGLQRLGRFVVRKRVAIVLAFAGLALVAVPGLASITVNDNPVRWFKGGSEIRVATEELNARLPGTFNANLLLEAERPGVLTAATTTKAVRGLDTALESQGVVGAATSYAELPPGMLSVDVGDATPAGGGHELVDSLLTSDGRRANIQLQMNDGDNQAMRGVVDSTERFLESNPLPAGVSVAWAGETYLNLVWQDKMVSGMLKAFLTTLVVILALMVVLFRSLRWAILAIMPVAWTVLIVYAAVGFAGKDYDMPVSYTHLTLPTTPYV